jgi:hypothetical protein
VQAELVKQLENSAVAQEGMPLPVSILQAVIAGPEQDL